MSTPLVAGRAKKPKRPKKPRQINSFSSSTSNLTTSLFPLPRLLIAYYERRRMDISHLTAPCIRNLVAAILVAKDLGFEMTPTCFDEMKTINKHASLPDRFIPIVPFPKEYIANKEQLRRKTELPVGSEVEAKAASASAKVSELILQCFNDSKICLR
ncbi:unnamed protein product [Cochlearia groenlandica]